MVTLLVELKKKKEENSKCEKKMKRMSFWKDWLPSPFRPSDSVFQCPSERTLKRIIRLALTFTGSKVETNHNKESVSAHW